MSLLPEKKYALIDTIIILTSIAIFTALLIVISYFGNPINDESFPFAVALRFITGQKPFIDDLSPFMTVGLLLTPLVKLSLFVHGGKNELILFLRHLYIVFQIGIGSYIFFSTRKYLPSFVAFYVAAMVVVYHPFGINNFHYDTLTTTLWAAVIFQLLNFIVEKKSNLIAYIMFAVLNLVLCFAYPTFVFLLLPLYAVSYFFLQEKTKFCITQIGIFSTCFLFMLWLIFDYYKVQYSDILNTISFSQTLFHVSTGEHHSFYKILLVSKLMLARYKIDLMVMICLVGAAYCFRKIKGLMLILLTLAMLRPLFEISIGTATYNEIFYFLNCSGFFGAIVFLFFLKQNKLAQRLFYWVWIPTLFAGFYTSVTSSNLDLNFNIGFYPSAILAFLFVYMVVEQELDTSKATDLIKYICTRAVLLYGLAMVGFFQGNYTYGSIGTGLLQYLKLSPYFIDGPFKGLYLDSNWPDKLEKMQKDIQRIDTDSSKFIYFGPISGGYLLVNNLKPGDYFLYCWYSINHYGRKIKIPSYIYFDFLTLGSPYDEKMKVYLSGALNKKIISNSYYAIYQVV